MLPAHFYRFQHLRAARSRPVPLLDACHIVA